MKEEDSVICSTCHSDKAYIQDNSVYCPACGVIEPLEPIIDLEEE